MVFSLLSHFNITLLQFFIFIFNSQKTDVQAKAKGFTSYDITSKGKLNFGPLTLWALWVSNFPTTIPHLHEEIVKPTAFSLARSDVESAIGDTTLKIRFKNLSVKTLRETLNPTRLVTAYRTAAPFLFSLLLHLVTTENRYRREKRYKEKASAAEPEPEPVENDDANEEESDGESDALEDEDDLQFHDRLEDFSTQDEEIDDENPNDILVDKSVLVRAHSTHNAVLKRLPGCYYDPKLYSLYSE